MGRTEVATIPSMHDEETLEDSWFDRPGGHAQVLTREAVMRALADPTSLAEARDAAPGPVWDGLEDSWFERPARERRR